MRMKTLPALIIAFGLSIVTYAQQLPGKPADILPKTFNPLNLQRQYDGKLLMEQAAKHRQVLSSHPVARPKPTGLKRADGQSVDTVAYFTAAQTYMKNYSFTYDGGDIKIYDIGIAVDGTKVTFKNLFNLYDPDNTYYVNTEYPVEGVYDPQQKTITIPASTNFANATVVGILGGAYVGTLICGTVDEEGTLSPQTELVFNVEGDFEAITTDQSFGVAQYTANGSQSYGQYVTYRSFRAVLPKAGSQLVAFNSSFDFGTTFPNTPIDRSVTLINMGADAADFVTTVESDGESFTSADGMGSVGGQDTASVTFRFSAAEPGEYEGIAMIEYENAAGSAEPILMQLGGVVEPFPDYSGIVKGGDFEFSTGVDYPFAMQTLDDGTAVAQSMTHGDGNASSWLNVKFTVPDGQVGRFSWKGKSFNTGYWYSNAGGMFVDDMNTAYASYTDAEATIDGEVELAPGEHNVKFQYDSYYYSGIDDNHLYVYDLCLDSSPADANVAELVTPTVDFGNFIVEGNTVEGQAEITLLNKGLAPLTVNAVGCDNEAFTVLRPSGSAEILKQLAVQVAFRADKAGTYEGKATLETSAGNFEVTLKALVRDMPDFSKIVAEGADSMTFTTNSQSPFIVEGDMAYNASSQQPDYTANTAWLQVNFSVPSGKVGYLSWDGHSYGTPGTSYSGDYSMFEISHPMNSGTTNAFGDTDAGSEAVFGSSDTWRSFLTCIPGDHYIKFSFYQCGDTVFHGKDRLELSNLRLHVIDFEEHSAELLDTEVVFDSTYVGNQRYTVARVRLHNTGSLDLVVNSIEGNAPFYGITPTSAAAFDKELEVELWFYPSEPGDFEGQLTIKTNAGDFVVDCKGVARSSDGLLLIGDIEDQAYGWSYYDADLDGECWNLGYNPFAGYYPEWCHGGNDCIGSASYSFYNGDIEPDNWLFSPAITIPADGAVMRWYAGSHSSHRPSETYSVYVATPEQVADAGSLGSLTPLLTQTLDTLDASVWRENVVDLGDYAGQTVNICFRHHNCMGQYVLKLDDIFVFTRDGWASGIKPAASPTAKPVAQEIYNAAGVRVATLARGLNIVKVYYDDGTVRTNKILRK